MPKPICSAPDDFSISPLLQLLPVKSAVARLKSFNSSLFARYEKVNSQISEAGASDSVQGEGNSAELKNLQAELLMLKQVLEWLDINTQES